jgi:predicted nucleic acid-binding protein
LTISVVLADANILFSRTLRDYVLYTADEGAIEVHWSRQILAEMSRNLRENLGLSHDSTSRLEQLMNDYIEYGLVEVDPGHLATVEAVAMDPKDRHVLTAALSADADILLTENTTSRHSGWPSTEWNSSPQASCWSASLTASLTRCGQPTRRPCATHLGPKLPSWPPLRRSPESTPQTKSARSRRRARPLKRRPPKTTNARRPPPKTVTHELIWTSELPDVDLRLTCPGSATRFRQPRMGSTIPIGLDLYHDWSKP